MFNSSTYHSFLRVSSLVCALVLVFESGLVNEATIKVSTGTHEYLANAIGASASVEPTELNQITAALTEQRVQLNERESALREREIEVNLAQSGQTNNDNATYILSSILFVLLVLILLNYTLDYLRIRESKNSLAV